MRATFATLTHVELDPDMMYESRRREEGKNQCEHAQNEAERERERSLYSYLELNRLELVLTFKRYLRRLHGETAQYSR